MTVQTAECTAEKQRAAFNPKHAVVVAAIAAFLATFNETFLNVAFTPIMMNLAVDVTTVQWLATAYMLGAAIMVPVTAFLYRSVPTKPLFLATMLLLIVGSIVGGLAPNFPVLLIGRIIQALGSGMSVPIAMSIVLEIAPRKKLGAYMGIMGAMTTLGPSLSLIAAGVLLSFFEWRVLFWVFGALCAVCFALAAKMLGNIAELSKPRLDMISVVLVSLALIGILYGVSTVFSGEIAIAGGSAVVGVICLVAFVQRQNTLEQPLINLAPFSNRAFTTGVGINVLTLVVVFAMNIVMPLFLQSALGVSSLEASLTIFPAIILTCVLSPIAGRLYDKQGIARILPVGFALIAAFVVVLCFAVVTGSVLLMGLLYVPIIGGTALIVGPVQSYALSRLDPALNLHGVTIMSTGFQVAGCIGSSVFTGIYAAVLSAGAPQAGATYQTACTAFMATGLTVAACALAGLGLAFSLRGRTEERRVAPAACVSLGEIMKTDIFTLHSGDKVLDAIRMFVEKGISGMPVVNDAGNPIGFVSDGDIMRYLADQTPAFKNQYSFLVEADSSSFDDRLAPLMTTTIGEICGTHVISVDANAGLGEVCRVLAVHRLKKVPVMEDGVMVGVINRSNITRYSMNGYLQSQGAGA